METSTSPLGHSEGWVQMSAGWTQLIEAQPSNQLLGPSLATYMVQAAAGPQILESLTNKVVGPAASSHIDRPCLQVRQGMKRERQPLKFSF